MRSRASSRSTAIPHSDTAEGSERPPAKPQRPPAKPRRPPAKSRRIRRRPTEHEDTDFEPGTLGSKRSRNQKSGDKAEPPSKRIRLRPPSIETLQLVIVFFITPPPFLPHCCRLIHNPQFLLGRKSWSRNNRISLSFSDQMS